MEASRDIHCHLQLHYICRYLEIPLSFGLKSAALYIYIDLELYLYMALVIATNFIVTIIFCSIMYFIYTMKIPFFEQYRVNKVFYKIFRMFLGLGNLWINKNGESSCSDRLELT